MAWNRRKGSPGAIGPGSSSPSARGRSPGGGEKGGAGSESAFPGGRMCPRRAAGAARQGSVQIRRSRLLAFRGATGGGAYLAPLRTQASPGLPFAIRTRSIVPHLRSPVSILNLFADVRPHGSGRFVTRQTPRVSLPHSRHPVVNRQACRSPFNNRTADARDSIELKRLSSIGPRHRKPPSPPDRSAPV